MNESHRGHREINDALLERMLLRRTAGSVPHELRASVLHEVASARRPWWAVRRGGPDVARVVLVLAGAALLGVVAGATLLAGGRPAPDRIPVRPAVAPAVQTTTPQPWLDSASITGTWEPDPATGSLNASSATGTRLHLDTDAPDVTGVGTLELGTRSAGGIAPMTGALRITTSAGSWSGTCTGGRWPADAGDTVAVSCWLTGTDGLTGRTLYLQLLGGTDAPMRVDGIVYRGAPPVPEEGHP